MEVSQGDVYWVKLKDQDGVESEYSHPQVIIQEDALNHSRIDTVVVCGISTNTKKLGLPGNVLLEAGEANLPKQSIVVVSQVSTVGKSALGEYIGTLSKERVRQILSGMRFLQHMAEHQ